MEKEKAAIAAEIKISITSNTFEEVETMIKQIKDACKSSEYKLSLSLEGNFSQKPTPDSDFWTAFFTEKAP
ncbi:MAG: hypothetical protein IJQ16_07325 [Selenomonadaceae bacterium]|nr:hypothetical protein [Selenomonadaceae bacterium]